MGTKYIVTIFLMMFTASTFAASCCGGGASLPNLITGDYRAQFTLSASNSGVTHTTDDDGDFIRRDGGNKEISETLTVMGAYQFSPLWQAGISIPMKKNTHLIADIEESSTGLGDVKAQIAYEFLPEYTYSKWKPRGFLFIQQTINNAKSTYDTKKELSTDSFGSGLQETSVGLSFVKIIGTTDFSFMGEYHQAPGKKFNQNGKSFTLNSGDGHSLLLAGGISPKNGSMRFGMNILYSHKEPSKFTGEIDMKNSVKEYLENGFNFSYMNKKQSYLLSYSDQSIFGRARNVNISKTISLSLVQFLDL